MQSRFTLIAIAVVLGQQGGIRTVKYYEIGHTRKANSYERTLEVIEIHDDVETGDKRGTPYDLRVLIERNIWATIRSPPGAGVMTCFQ